MNTVDVVEPHSKHADYYRYRMPYGDRFFSEVANRVPLGKSDRILDLCCGNGQLAAGCTKHVKHIVGIDGARGMISRAHEAPNTKYHCHDVNAEELPAALAGQQFDHMLLGRAIPYVTNHSLQRWTSKHLAREGSVVVCGAGLASTNEWATQFNQLRGSYAPVRGDFIGARKLAAAGYFIDDTISVRSSMECKPQFLLAYSLSYSLSHTAIRSDLDTFRRRLLALLQPHIDEGKLHGDVISWALIYRRSGRMKNGSISLAQQIRSGL